MNVQQLLEQAEKCKTNDEANNLLLKLQELFGDTKALSHLPQLNSEAYIEDNGKPYVRFEIIRFISHYYITTVRPEIRDGAMAVVVVMHHMKDGLGMGSSNNDVAEGFDEEVIEASPEHTVDELAERAKELALDDHRMLIKRVGVAEDAAYEAALKSW